MESTFSENELIGRAKNFRWNIEEFEKSVHENESYFLSLEILRDEIIRFSISEPVKDLSKPELLHRIFYQIYRLFKISGFDLRLFCKDSPLSERIYESCLFTTLCSFLHATKRIKGSSLKDFVLHNHPLDFDNIESPNYRTSLWDSESDKLRKARNRLFSKNNSVYIKNDQWAGMTKDAEHEWRFFYVLDNVNADETIRDTYKRIGNLYTGIDQALDSPKDSGYSDRIKEAYKKFLSKLKKIRYEDALNLFQRIYSHINEDKEFYGLNIYRFERRLTPYCIINDVKRLLACQNAEERTDYLMKTVALKDVIFPKIYGNLVSLPFSFDQLKWLADEFSIFVENISISSCLIIDELVEKGVFGSDWEHLFCDMLNDMTEEVFYKPADLDFTITTEPQIEYEALLAVPVYLVLSEAADTLLDFGVSYNR